MHNLSLNYSSTKWQLYFQKDVSLNHKTPGAISGPPKIGGERRGLSSDLGPR